MSTARGWVGVTAAGLIDWDTFAAEFYGENSSDVYTRIYGQNSDAIRDAIADGWTIREVSLTVRNEPDQE